MIQLIKLVAMLMPCALWMGAPTCGEQPDPQPRGVEAELKDLTYIIFCLPHHYQWQYHPCAFGGIQEGAQQNAIIISVIFNRQNNNNYL
jgi:hypothetical protein